ncbi:hypothetical protein [Halarcobacter sp.]|uniref:hypothetical protein n=1 Tax=Halarcobacter sp. TaxID=2321133 RepID=UPI0029F51F34|nr:hypothetical protein [Halarcobacter sp.]
MIKEIVDFFYSFKNKTIESDILVLEYGEQIKKYANMIINKQLDKEYEENYLTILGYSLRLEDIKQRIFFTFQEAVYAIDLDKLMKNEDSMKLNSIVYILVLNTLINEFKGLEIDKELYSKALDIYRQMEERKSKENQKYHIYQY